MEKQKSTLKQRLTYKYRMVILNEDTYEERFSFKLSRMNVYVYGGVSAIVLILLTTMLIIYTPLREYVPGHTTSALRKKVSVLTSQLDSLGYVYHANDTKLEAMMSVMKGDEKVANLNEIADSLTKRVREKEDARKLNASKEDSIFRKDIANRDKFNVNSSYASEIGVVLFSPVTGTITNRFDDKNQHYAVDVATKKNSPIKAIADGVVIFSEWSVDTGNVIILEHSNNLLSVYKHNSLLYKKQGDLVKSGEVIATAGSTGKLSTATHLHFELWYNSYPIDPTLFMDFE